MNAEFRLSPQGRVARRVSKLYVKGACVSTRDNNFELKTALSNVNCGNKTDDYSTATCMDVILNGALRQPND
jgi:hypothetical protein